MVRETNENRPDAVIDASAENDEVQFEEALIDDINHHLLTGRELEIVKSVNNNGTVYFILEANAVLQAQTGQIVAEFARRHQEHNWTWGSEATIANNLNIPVATVHEILESNERFQLSDNRAGFWKDTQLA